MKPIETPDFRPCMDCISYDGGVCSLHGVKVQGTTLDRACFKPKANAPLTGGEAKKGGAG
jgi:hypothetical protein